MHTTEQALEASIGALRDGMSPYILRSALISDGFKPNKAETIIRWASQYLRKRKENGNLSSAQMVSRKPTR